MSWWRGSGGRLVVVATSVALVVASSASGFRTLARPGTIRITDRLIRHTHVEVGGKGGGSAGDFDFYRHLLFNKRITPKAIGHSDITCTETGSGSWNCSGTYFLPKGKIVAGGVIGSRLFYEFPVLGGTGLYNNVRGTLTVTSLSRRPARDLLVFRLQA